MNLVDCYVTELLSEVFKDSNTHFYGVKVKFNSYGVESETELYFDTEKEAKKVKVGYKFLN